MDVSVRAGILLSCLHFLISHPGTNLINIDLRISEVYCLSVMFVNYTLRCACAARFIFLIGCFFRYLSTLSCIPCNISQTSRPLPHLKKRERKKTLSFRTLNMENYYLHLTFTQKKWFYLYVHLISTKIPPLITESKLPNPV